MTISSTNRKAGPYIGNGSASSFPFSFKVFQASDLDVVRLNVSTNVETALVLTTDYTVVLNSDQDSSPGGTITLVAGALATGFNLVITSDLPNLQPTDLTNQGGFYPDVINDALDRATIQIQQLQEGLDRAALLPITSSADAASLVADIVRLADSADNLDIDANNIGSINTVATNIANVNTTASNIASVNTAAGSIANINTTAANITNVNAVGSDLLEPVSEINTVAVNIANVNTVGDNIANVNTVAGNNSNVTTVAGSIANVNTVGGAIANVNVTAANIANVNAVGSDLLEPVSEINTVATDIANVNTVGNNISNVNTVAGISGNVTTVAGISSNVTTVATNNANVTTVATNIANVNNVGGSISNVNTVATNIVAVNSAYTNLAAIIAAPTEAANAAASAAAAAAYAASGMYSAVQDKSADYTVVVGDAGDLIRMTTSGGARTVTLPAISTVPDGFNVTVVKWTGDANNVTVTRSGSDLINGSTSYVLDAQYKSATFVADAQTSTWFASGSGGAGTNIIVDAFNGTGSQTAFTLSGDPGSENNTQVFVGGVYQKKDTYSLSGSTLTFSAAPPSGTSNIEVVWSQPLAIGTPADGTVSTVKLADAAVTASKMGVGAAVSNIGAGGIGTNELAAAAVTPAKLSADAQYTGFKNRIINGACMIDQRNAGASAAAAHGTYYLDRYAANIAGSGFTSTIQQSSTAPSGFAKSLAITTSTTKSPAANEGFNFYQKIEGTNIADLGWGAVGASAVTLSFWVRSSKTGTFSVSLLNGGADRTYVATYTINAANTWEQKTITVAGETTGTWLTTNGVGLQVYFCVSNGGGSMTTSTLNTWQNTNYYLGYSSVSNLFDTNGATFYITGVQLEKGSTATSFDYRPYGTELALCQRYYERSYDVGTATGTADEVTADWGVASSDTSLFLTGNKFKVTKRSSPTMTFYNTATGASGSFVAGATTMTVSSYSGGTASCARLYSTAGHGTIGVYSRWHWTASSEL